MQDNTSENNTQYTIKQYNVRICIKYSASVSSDSIGAIEMLYYY